MTDGISLQSISDRSPDRIALLDTDILARLGRELADAKASLADVEARLGAALDYKYGEKARDRRLADGQGQRQRPPRRRRLRDRRRSTEAGRTGSAGVAAVVVRIRDAGDDPAEYVKTRLEVSERAYTAWPQRIRAIFEPARTVTFEVRASEVANPRPSDQLTVGGEVFVAQGEPERRDPDRLVWNLDARRA
jgi:hypothetical protein